MRIDEPARGARYQLLIPASPSGAVVFEELPGLDEPEAEVATGAVAGGAAEPARAGPDRYREPR
jgi:hypothetical protein